MRRRHVSILNDCLPVFRRTPPKGWTFVTDVVPVNIDTVPEYLQYMHKSCSSHVVSTAFEAKLFECTSIGYGFKSMVTGKKVTIDLSGNYVLGYRLTSDRR